MFPGTERGRRDRHRDGVRDAAADSSGAVLVAGTVLGLPHRAGRDTAWRGRTGRHRPGPVRLPLVPRRSPATTRRRTALAPARHRRRPASPPGRAVVPGTSPPQTRGRTPSRPRPHLDRPLRCPIHEAHPPRGPERAPTLPCRAVVEVHSARDGAPRPPRPPHPGQVEPIGAGTRKSVHNDTQEAC